MTKHSIKRSTDRAAAATSTYRITEARCKSSKVLQYQESARGNERRDQSNDDITTSNRHAWLVVHPDTAVSLTIIIIIILFSEKDRREAYILVSIGTQSQNM